VLVAAQAQQAVGVFDAGGVLVSKDAPAAATGTLARCRRGYPAAGRGGHGADAGLLTGTGLAVPTLYIAGSGTVPVRADRRDAVQMEGRANGPH
jgi:hypothetical protein